MAVKLKPSRRTFFSFHVFFVKGMLFNQFKFKIGTTMAILFLRGLNMGIFQNIQYLSHHISDNILF